jgi:hypothetical protein
MLFSQLDVFESRAFTGGESAMDICIALGLLIKLDVKKYPLCSMAYINSKNTSRWHNGCATDTIDSQTKEEKNGKDK